MYSTIYHYKDVICLELFIKKLDKLAIFLIIYTILFFAIVYTLPYTIPFILALIFAYILQFPVKFLVNKLRFNNSIASLFCTIILFSIIVYIIFYLVTFGITEIQSVSQSIQTFTTSNYSKMNSYVNNLGKMYKDLDPTVISTIEKNFSDYVSRVVSETLNISGQLMSILLNFVSYVPYLILVFIFTLLSTYFFTKDLSLAKNKILDYLPFDNSDKKILFLIKEIKRMLLFFCLSTFIIICITFVETLITYLFLGVNYAVLLSIITACCDIIPIIGIGIVFLPLIFIYLIIGKLYTSISLLIAYVIISIIRQIIGPKVFSSTLGIHPIPSLIALFIGMEAAGAFGVFYALFLLIFFNIFRNLKIL